MTVLGDAWVKIQPDLAGFQEKVQTGVTGAIKGAQAEAQASADALAKAEGNLAAAQERQAAATGRVADAQAELVAAEREATAAAEAQAGAQDGDAAAANRNAEAQARLAGAQARVDETSLAASRTSGAVTSAENDVAAASDRAAEAHGRSSSALQSMAGVGGPLLLGVAGAAGVVAAGSLKLAANFQEATTQLVTGAGESEQAIGGVRKGILDMAGPVAQTPMALAQGMFMIESAGYRGAAGLDVLRNAAEGARVGGADLQTTANATTTVMSDFHLQANQSADAVNFLTSVVQQGKTHMQDLAGAISQVLPTAAVLSPHLDQIGGALATMTAHGVDAHRAATSLRFELSALANETPKGAAALDSVGLSSTQVATDLQTKGLIPTLQEITDAVGKKFPAGGAEYNAAMADISGGTRGLTGVLLTTGQNMDQFVSSAQRVAQQMDDNHGRVMGWQNAQKDLNTQLGAAKAQGEAWGISIGSFLIPKVIDLMHGIQDTVNWFRQHQAAAEALGGVLATLATVFIGAYVIVKVQAMVSAFRDAVGVLGAFGRTILGLPAAAGPIEQTGTAASTAGGEITGMGDQATVAAGEVKGLGGAATAAGGEITGLGGEAAAAGGQLSLFGGEAAGAEAEIGAGGLAGAAEGAAGGAGRMSMAFSGLMGSFAPLLAIGGALGYLFLDTKTQIDNATGAAARWEGRAQSNIGTYQGLSQEVQSATDMVNRNNVAWWDNGSIITNWADKQKHTLDAMTPVQRELVNAKGHVDQLSQAWNVSGDEITRAASQMGVTIHQLGNAGHDAQIAFGLSIDQIGQKIGTLPPQLAQDMSNAETGMVNAIRFGQAPGAASTNAQAIIDNYNKLNTIPGLGAQALDALRQNVVMHGNMVTAATVGNVNDIIGNYNRLPPPLQQAALSAMAELNAGLASGNQQAINDAQSKLQVLEDAYKQTGGHITGDMQRAIDDYNRALDAGNTQAATDAQNKLILLEADYNNAIGPITGAGAAAGQGFAGAMANLLQGGEAHVTQILGAYQHDVAAGLDPILESVGAATIPVVISGAGGTNVYGAHFEGGIVDRPTFFAGEEGPAHKEAVISWNPAYRDRNVNLWALTGQKLGIPGFAQGGVPGQLEPPDPAAFAPYGMNPAIALSIAGGTTPGMGYTGYSAAMDIYTKAQAKIAADQAAAVSSGGGDPFGGGPVKAYMLGEVAKRWPGVAQASAFDYLEMREAGYNANAANPTSDARGLGQNISGWGPGYEPGNVQQQTAWMLNYIAGRYGDPIGAAAHERAFNWYDLGGELMPGLTMAMNTSGRAETVIPAGASDVMGSLTGILQAVEQLVGVAVRGPGGLPGVPGAPGGPGLVGATLDLSRNLTIQGSADAATVDKIQALLAAEQGEIEQALVGALANWGFRPTPTAGTQ